MTTVKIARELLESKGACWEGVELFDTLFGDAVEVDVSHPGYQIGMLMHPKARRFLGWLWAEGIMPMWSLAEIRWSGADLSGANLSGANLYGANLYGANLSGANHDGYTCWPVDFGMGRLA